MLPIPKLDQPSVVFGDSKHMPKWATLPEDFRDRWSERDHPWCSLASGWFYRGVKFDGDGKPVIDGVKLHPKDGVNQDDAIRAIKAVLGSWVPKHEHKIAGVGFMLSEWFDREVPDEKTAAE